MKTPQDILENQAGGVLSGPQLAECREDLTALTARMEQEQISSRAVFGLNTEKFIKEMVLSRVMPEWLLWLCTITIQFSYILGGVTLFRAVFGLARGAGHFFSSTYTYHWLFVPVLAYSIISAVHPACMQKSLKKDTPWYARHYRLVRIITVLAGTVAGICAAYIFKPALSVSLLLFLYLYIAGILAYGIFNTLAQNHFFLCMQIGFYQMHPKRTKEEVYLLANQLYEQSYAAFCQSANPNKNNEAYFRLMKRDGLRTSRLFVFAGFFLMLVLCAICAYICITAGISTGCVLLLAGALLAAFLFLLGILYEKVMFVTLASLDAL